MKALSRRGPTVADGIFEGIIGPGIDLPVPDESIALLRMPVALGSLSELIAGLKGTYGDGLVIRTDAGITGWMVIARTDSDDSARAEQ